MADDAVQQAASADTNPIIRWRRSSLKFVIECIGATPTNQQTEALLLLDEMYEARMAASLGAKLTKRQKELAGKFGISIVSGHGTGKDSLLSWIFLWLLVCFPQPKGIVTAPTSTQLDTVLWPELNLWIQRSKGKLDNFLGVKADHVYAKHDKRNHFITKRTAAVKGSDDEQAEALAGAHADYLVLAVDEASGVPNGVFRPLEGAMTGLFNIAILISNPTRSSGYFYNTHNSDRENWCPLWWDCEKSNMDEVRGNNAMSMYIERMAKKYGRDSAFYKMRVRGMFPSSDPDSLIPLEWIMDAVGRDVEPIEGQRNVLGVDVARYGQDKSIILDRRGPRVEDIEEHHKIDTMELTGWVSVAMAERKPAATLVDVIGVGAGVVDRLIELGRPNVFGVNVAESPSRDDQFIRLRDELYWRVRTWFESRRSSIPNDDELIGELSTIRYKPDSQGRIKVEGKLDLKKRLPDSGSPNKADALMLTFFYDDSNFREEMVENDPYDEGEDEGPDNERGWMSA